MNLRKLILRSLVIRWWRKSLRKITRWRLRSLRLSKSPQYSKCAKCGTTSLWEELFAIVEGKSFMYMNYTGPPFISKLSNRKLWTNIEPRGGRIGPTLRIKIHLH
mmetsp:Transcript_32291/g.48772  ORF Transcript_32291/g.48772 Transcript_32291/m.48772 type:complete len:105 (-) Transcript_32291:586-900(-)